MFNHVLGVNFERFARMCLLAFAAMSVFALSGAPSGWSNAMAQEHVRGAPRVVANPSTRAAGDASQFRTSVSQRLTEHLRRTSGDRVFFGPGSSQLGLKARAVLSAQALWMKKRPRYGALISGYADDPGTNIDNKRLATERANAVRQRLVDEGVSASRIVLEAVGRSEPVATCHDTVCSAQNRRVVTSVLYELPNKIQQNSPAGTPSEPTAPHRGAALQIP